jgi:molybdenum cofactor synthesis domain-containing protein
MNLPGEFKALIITLSDRAHRRKYRDLSGPRIKEMLEEYFRSEKWDIKVNLTLLPDDSARLRELFNNACNTCNIIITTGGTGIGPRDITIETIKPLLSKELPGIMEFIRVKYGYDKPNALLSRGIAGVAGKALVYTLPGSVRAVDEYMTEILKTLKHTIYMQYGIDAHSKNQ